MRFGGPGRVLEAIVSLVLCQLLQERSARSHNTERGGNGGTVTQIRLESITFHEQSTTQQDTTLRIPRNGCLSNFELGTGHRVLILEAVGGGDKLFPDIRSLKVLMTRDFYLTAKGRYSNKWNAVNYAKRGFLQRRFCLSVGRISYPLDLLYGSSLG